MSEDVTTPAPITDVDISAGAAHSPPHRSVSPTPFELRRRSSQSNFLDYSDDEDEDDENEPKKSSARDDEAKDKAYTITPRSPVHRSLPQWVSSRWSFWLTRIVMLRLLAFVHAASFVAAATQLPSLLGVKGLLPAVKYLDAVELSRKGSEPVGIEAFIGDLNIFWLFREQLRTDDWPLLLVSLIGLAVSVFILLRGSANVFLIAILWICQHSIREIGQLFWGYGWELQLAETTFLTLFLVPFFSLEPLPPRTPTSKTVLWLYRWLLARIMVGAGLIKIRSDPCWRELTCMNYFYETQPIPSPTSWYFHNTPPLFHALEAWVNHAVELGLPVLLLIPFSPTIRRLGGIIQLGFQAVLICSGNLAYLNWLTIIPAIACFDDGFLRPLFSSTSLARASAHRETKVSFWFRWPNPLVSILLVTLIVGLSLSPVVNMLSPTQAMNRSFDRYNIVNTYGNFGSVGKERLEVVLLGQERPHNSTHTPPWIEYEFHCKPGSVSRLPCILGPYHRRLDWQIWFAAMQRYQQNPWLLVLVGRLLQGTPHTLDYFTENPFPNEPPAKLQLDLYRYKFTTDLNAKDWWVREYVGPYVPFPLSLDNPQFYDFFQSATAISKP